MTDKLSPLGKAIVGGLVADAATVPLHWHYDVDAMTAIVRKEGKLRNPEFFTPNSTKYYSAKDFPGHYDLGQLSCYGEQSIMTLEYFESTKGKFLGGESFSQFMFQWFKNYDGRQDHPTKEFLEKAEKLTKANKKLYPEAGADDKQTMHTFKIPVIALKLLGGDEDKYLDACETATRAHQNTDRCADFGRAYGLMLKHVLNGTPLTEVIQQMIEGKLKVSKEVSSALEFVLEKRAKASYDKDGWDGSVKEFALELSHWLFDKYDVGEKMKNMIGLTCQFPGSFIASMKVVLDTFETFPAAKDLKKEGLAFGIRRNILFGGDNCGRSMVIGPLLVAAGADIPNDFLGKMNQADLTKYVGLIEKVSKF